MDEKSSTAIDPRALAERFAAAGTYAAATAILLGLIQSLGFSDFNYGATHFYDSLVSSMPPEWIAHYRDAEFWRTDQLVIAARGQVTPFLVSDVFTMPPASVPDAEMREAIAEHPRGLVIPIHCPVVGFALAAYFTTMDDGALAAALPFVAAPLTLITLVFHEVAKRFYIHGPTTDHRRALSGRERSILSLSAQGKTSSAIATILGLSIATVNNHFARILRKLNATSRSQATAIAQATGQIERLD